MEEKRWFTTTHTIASGVNGQPDGTFDSSITAPSVTTVIFKIPLLLKYYLVLVLFGNCPSLVFLLLILLLFFFFVFCRCWCTRYPVALLLLLLQRDILVYWRYILSHFLDYGLLRNCRFSLLLISAITHALRLSCEELWLGIPPDGTDDVVARYTLFLFPFLTNN